MPRKARRSIGGVVYHVLNRANARRHLFYRDADYVAFFKALAETRERFPGVRLFSLCVMPNHWHLVLRPQRDGELSRFMGWLTQTHTQRWRHAKHTVGYGALYQGRSKSFLVQEDCHFLTLCRYVERNALRARLADRAEAWPWSSAWIRLRGDKEQRLLLRPWPIRRPARWVELLNEPQSEAEEQQVGQSIERSRPLGDPDWSGKWIKRLGLEHTVRGPGRPRKADVSGQ